MRRIIALLLLLSATYGSAQQFHFKEYSLEAGLSRSGVYYILQDNAGFLWIGTEGGGVCKFDGIKFTNYSRRHGLAAENVRVIFQDDRNIIWFGTSNGLSYFNGRGIQSLTVEDGLADNYIRSITQDHEGNLWVGTNKGISIIDPDEKGISGKLKINFTLPHMKIRSLLAQDDVVWIGTDQGLCKYQNHEIEVFTTEEGLSNNLILNMFVDSKENLWIGTQNGINKYYKDTLSYWGLEDGLINKRVRSITEDNRGNIWAGTSDGISIFDGTKFLNLNEENGLSNDRIRCLTNDSFGNIWVGTFFGGIMRFNHQNFVAYTPAEGLISNQILSINEDEKGDIIVGTYDGVSKMKIKDGKLQGSKSVNLENGLQSNSVRTVYKDKNANYWYGTDQGITIIGPSGITQIDQEDGLVNSEITVIKNFQDRYWVGTGKGLAIIEETTNYKDFDIKFLDRNDGIAGKEVSSIMEDDQGEVWIGFSDGQVSIFEDDRLVNPVLDESVSEVLTMAIDSSGQIWLGTNGNGIFYGKYSKKTHKINLKNITINENLMSNTIYSLLMSDGQIWAGHENGLDLISWNDDSTYLVKSFGPETGFFGLQNNQNASFKDSEGNLWFGTVNGLFSLKGDEVKHFSDGSPSVNYITSVKIKGEKIDWSESEWSEGNIGQFNLPDNLTLPYDQNNISFDFIGLNFISPKNVRYRWRLDGFSETWCAPTRNTYASYTNLEAGEYSFLLQSSDEHGVIIDKTKRFDFKIEKPFWLQWWFIITAGVVGFFLILGIMRLRTRNLIKQRNALEDIIADRTKEIQHQADELTVKNKEVTDSIQYSRRIQGSILPGKKQLDGLFESYFIFYKPKDIVSGDFYWVDRNVNNKKQIFFAAADCTGHGVPGAMVSLIGTRALTTSVRENLLSNTNEILDSTNEIVVDAFTDAISGEIIKDGMDISLCSLDYSNEEECVPFQFSGAQNPAWIVRKESLPNLMVDGIELEPNMNMNGLNLFELKGSKQPIGYFEASKPFDVHKSDLQKEDVIYLFTDGFADQFGGEKGKKFKYKTLKQLILNSQGIPVSEQKGIFHDAFYDWKRDMEQVDDICLMGIEV
jgi:ligand-binding sensor domain-containing protein/serine phosphatase RsbU (regulator of sigma subunit)